jgi:transposase
MGHQALTLLRLLEAACRNADELAGHAEAAFAAHPDATIIASFPRVGQLTGARILAEIGENRSRFTDARGLKAYAGSAPITRASRKFRTVATRRINNQRLAAAGYAWAFSSLTASAGARAHYDRQRSRGDAKIVSQSGAAYAISGSDVFRLKTTQACPG